MTSQLPSWPERRGRMGMQPSALGKELALPCPLTPGPPPWLWSPRRGWGLSPHSFIGKSGCRDLCIPCLETLILFFSSYTIEKSSPRVMRDHPPSPGENSSPCSSVVLLPLESPVYRSIASGMEGSPRPLDASFLVLSASDLLGAPVGVRAAVPSHSGARPSHLHLTGAASFSRSFFFLHFCA